MSDYILQVNQYSGGPTGHVNYTLIGPGVYETWGNNLTGSTGVQNEGYKLSDPTRTSVQISLSQEDFNRTLNFARAADLLNNNYFGLCNNCVDFLNAGLQAAGKGDWAAANYLTDDSLVDMYAKAAEYICGSPYVDLATSAVLNALASASNLSAATEFVEHMSWLADHENGTDFYFDPSNYDYFEFDPDVEADYRLASLKALGSSLGISVNYDPIDEKVILGVASPIVLDLDGDGIETTSYSDQSVYFDIDGDGVKDRTAWLSGDDAFLAVDKNANGQIDGVHELFGGLVRGEGFAKLADYDSNGDGQVDNADERYAELLVWQDADMDGFSDAGELRNASSAGLDSISTSYTSQDVYQHNNLLGEVSTAMWRGQSIDAIDVYFRFKPGAGVDTSPTAHASNGIVAAPAEPDLHSMTGWNGPAPATFGVPERFRTLSGTQAHSHAPAMIETQAAMLVSAMAAFLPAAAERRLHAPEYRMALNPDLAVHWQ